MTPFFAKMPMAALQCGSKYEYRGFCAGRVFNTLLIPWLLVQLRFLQTAKERPLLQRLRN